MPLIETESLILKTYDLADADKIVVFLTRDHGLTRGVAKGAKRLKSRFGSGLEPFAVSRMTYLQKETLELVSVKKIDLTRSYFTEASDPDFLRKFAYLIDLLIESVPPNDPNEALYRMVCACLDAGSARPEGLNAISLYFEVWLLRLTGYLPDWRSCERCGRKLDADGSTILNQSFRLTCSHCRQPANATIVSEEERSVMANALRLSPLEFVEFAKVNKPDLSSISGILNRILSQALGRPVAERPFPTAGKLAG